jgi:hypothetical protein
MANYNYTPGGTSDVDKLRLLIPDRLNSDYLPPGIFSDEELDSEMDIWGSIFLAAASCCEQIAMDKAKQAILVSLEAGSGGSSGGRQLVTIDKRRVPEFFLKRAEELKKAEAELSDQPSEYVDSVDYFVTRYGETFVDYVGNVSSIDDWDL